MEVGQLPQALAEGSDVAQLRAVLEVELQTPEALELPHALALFERFDRRGTEPFELFRSEFGQNCIRIQEILLEFIRNPKNSGFCHFETKYSLESSCRDLQDLIRFACFCTAQTSIFQKLFVKLFRIFRHFVFKNYLFSNTFH
jgi:hypothetical protein